MASKDADAATTIKVPKGTRDIDPFQAAVREDVIEKVKTVFKQHGAVTIETPVFELKEILTGKYGEDSKLIYDLADQGGELCALRYDLTVPFARYVAMYNIDNMKRYHIAKVYRRDNPAMGKGRYREFYQCDCDIAGVYDPMIPDAECVKMMTEIFQSLKLGEYCIKLNHRKILDGIFEISGVPEGKFRAICSAVDKLDKEPWEAVRAEMIETKGLDPACADKIGEFVQINGAPWEVLNKLKAEAKCVGSTRAMEGLADMELLFGYLDVMGVGAPQVKFDLSLARGLDYYTGLIYEAVLVGSHLGSIAGGGRYDNLVGMYCTRTVPCVGFSVGIERVFSILEENARSSGNVNESPTDVMVISLGAEVHERIKLINLLWASGIRAEMTYKVNAKLKPQLRYADAKKMKFACIIGEDELAKGVVQIKSLVDGTQAQIPRSEVCEYLTRKLNASSNNNNNSNNVTGVPSPYKSLEEFNAFIATRSYIGGYQPSAQDLAAYEALGSEPSANFPHARRFFRAIAALSTAERARLK